MKRIFFNEVATRDGFQIEPAFIPTDVKVALVDAFSDCGYAKIEVTSFTSPKAIPMLRDAEEVMGRIRACRAWNTPCWCPMCAGPSARWSRARTS
jgi:hydroxymethylglutaryl-CoA lyase